MTQYNTLNRKLSNPQPLGLTAAASVTDTAIQKKIFGSGLTTLIILNEEMNDTMKIVKSLKNLVY